jgi:predicted DNA-binding transcriptional regulator AlpA
MSASPSHPLGPRFERDGPESRRSANFDASSVPKVLNLAEAASLVRCSRAHLCNIVNGKIRGIPRLPSVRIGRRVLFRRESIELWLQQVESAGPTRTSV